MWDPATPLWAALADRSGRAPHAARADPPIPRLVHQIWLGGPAPSRLRALMETWGGDAFVWDDVRFERLRPHLLASQGGEDCLLSRLPNLGAVSDELRYELLYAVGGTYVDADAQRVGDLSPLRSSSSFAVGVSHTPVWELNNAVLGCARGHPLLLAVLAELHGQPYPTRVNEGGGGRFMDTITHSGPGMLTRVVMRCLAQADARGQALEDVVGDAVSAQLRQRIDASSTALRGAVLEVLGEAWRSELCALPSSSSPPSWPSSSVRVLPKHVFYPLPNTSKAGPPDWTAPSPEGKAAFHDLYGPVLHGEEGGAAASLASLDWKLSAVPGEVGEYMRPDTLAVHYWARTWQRKDAQRGVSAGAAAQG